MDKHKKYVCIHGHFYQPPRENAWIEMLELQKSAAPFHDWNERITAECYATNANARILDAEGFIEKIVNNYARISFNFGPTLLSWMQVAAPAAYQAIIEADQASIEYFNGHGTALAQVYNHIIMPLANERDKHTQVIWGIRDFEYRFKRKPKGMWLAETAVDLATLEVLVDHGIEFTILAPRQAKAIRAAADLEWEQLEHAAIDPRRPYVCQLKSGRSISLFFYDGHIAQGVAFSGLLNSGKHFAKALIHTLDDNDECQLAHIATDGESYGHHHKKGEMALADCLDVLANRTDVSLCNYASFLADHPAEWEVQIYENSSWSCVHGVERWRSDCGCHTGGNEGWTQAWREPLRLALDELRDALIPIFEQQAALYLKDPWAARNDYISVVFNRSETNWELFLDENGIGKLDKKAKENCRQLLEMQRQSMLMYTSCGWFFDEISGLETIQILQYAHRAMTYASGLSGQDFQASFIERLQKAPSNKYKTGAKVFEEFVLPTQINEEDIARYFAVAQMNETIDNEHGLSNFKVVYEKTEQLKSEGSILLSGKMDIQSIITLEECAYYYIIVQHKNEINGWLIKATIDLVFSEKINKIQQAFTENPAQTSIAMNDLFGTKTFTLNDLFKDQQRKIIAYFASKLNGRIVLESAQISMDNKELIQSIEDHNLPMPHSLKNTLQAVCIRDFQHILEQKTIGGKEMIRLKDNFKKWTLNPIDDAKSTALATERLLQEQKTMRSDENMQTLLQFMDDLDMLGVPIDLKKQQDLYFTQLENETDIKPELWNELAVKLNIKTSAF